MSEPQPLPASTRRFIESDRIEGTAIYDAEGHRVGVVKSLIIEKVSGQAAFVIIAFDGFFGIGADNHAIPWSKLRYDQDMEGCRTDMTEEQLRAAPDFRVSSDDQQHSHSQAFYRIPPSGRAI